MLSNSFVLDPHIKVQGDPENVKKAKEKIMAVLDTKVGLVTQSPNVANYV